MDPQSAARTCPKHSVVLDPLGHCVICRREDLEVDEDAGGARKAVSGLGLLAVAVGCVLLYKGMTGRVEAPVITVDAGVVAPTPAPALDDLSAVQEDARAAAQARDTEERRIALERKMREVPIDVYTTPWCDLCKAATAYLKGRGYRFTERDVEASPDTLAAMRRHNPKNTVPTIVVADEVIVGFGPGVVTAAVYRAAEKQLR
jgi:glutaredoxin 3